jgi:hypothetical protein
MAKKNGLKRAWSVDDVQKTKHDKIELSTEFAEAFGQPLRTGLWFIWGDSGNGKTRFALQLCKELCRFGRVGYNSLEEGNSDTMQAAFAEVGMASVKRKLVLLHEPMDELSHRLTQPKSPDIIFIDSWQYTFMTFNQLLEFKRRHADKLIIILSQADGKQPEGRTAKRVMFDAALKIWVEGYRAISKGRYFGPKGYYTIWPEGAAKYYGAA